MRGSVAISAPIRVFRLDLDRFKNLNVPLSTAERSSSVPEQKLLRKQSSGEEPLNFRNGGADAYLGFAIWGRRNYLGSEIFRSQMFSMWSEIWGRRDHLGSNISRMSLSKPFLCVRLVFKTGQLIIWGL